MNDEIRNRWKISEEYKSTSMEIMEDNLASLRARIGITQEELANIIGISRQTYCTFETGKRDMTWTVYLALLFFFEGVKETSEMIRDLHIYPIDLVMRFNGECTDDGLDRSFF